MDWWSKCMSGLDTKDERTFWWVVCGDQMQINQNWCILLMDVGIVFHGIQVQSGVELKFMSQNFSKR